MDEYIINIDGLTIKRMTRGDYKSMCESKSIDFDDGIFNDSDDTDDGFLILCPKLEAHRKAYYHYGECYDYKYNGHSIWLPKNYRSTRDNLDYGKSFVEAIEELKNGHGMSRRWFRYLDSTGMCVELRKGSTDNEECKPMPNRIYLLVNYYTVEKGWLPDWEYIFASDWKYTWQK